VSAQIEIIVTHTLEPGNLYRVNIVVDSAVDITPDIFVYETVSENFSHVALPWDIDNIPYTSLAAAQTAGANYYRLSTVTRDFTTVLAADEFSRYTRGRIAWLVNEYIDDVATFVGVNNYTYPVP
jgi:hypothetical protein